MTDPVVSPADTIRPLGYCHVRKEDLHGGSALNRNPPFAAFDVVHRRDYDALLAVGERDRRHIAQLTEALAGIGWMPCADSSYWCFCKEPSEPGSHHGDGCIMASGLLALAGRCGSDRDKPTPDTLTDSLGRSLAQIREANG